MKNISARDSLIYGAMGCLCVIGSYLALPARSNAQTQQGINWPTFGGSNSRNNYNSSETVLSTTTVPALKKHWKHSLGSLVNVQPTLATSVTTPTGVFDLLMVVSTGGDVTALDAATGNVIWSTNIPKTVLPCQGKSPSFGIGAPATLDVANDIVYVVDAGGNLHALALATGVEVAGFPVEVIDGPNLAASSWVHYASPTLVGGSLYLTTAASCEGTTVPYHGQIIQFSLATDTVVQRYYPLGNGSVYGGGMWGVGGVAADPDGVHLWAATGNSLPAPQNSGNAEKILQLDQSLNLDAVHGPVLSSKGDLDFGTTPLLFQPAGCPPMLAAMNKTGLLVMYNTQSLTAGPVQAMTISDGGSGGKFFGMPSYDPTTGAVYVSNPKDSSDGTYPHGLVALQAGANCKLSLMWQATIGENGNTSPSVTPAIANGVVYWAGGTSKILAAYNDATGALLWSTTLEGQSNAAPFVANGQLYAVGKGTVYAFGL